MRPKKTRAALRELRRLARINGIEFIHILGGGKGSHGTVVFFDPRTGDRIRFTIPGDVEISPGVQRGCRSRVDEIVRGAIGSAGRKALAELVRGILDKVFF